MIKALEAPIVTLSKADLDHFHREGYLIVRQVFGQKEVHELLDLIMRRHANRDIPGYHFVTEEEGENDPLRIYSRIMMPHRFDELSKRWLLDPRVGGILQQLLDEEPICTQSMFYFKPPGSRGQALHQDNFYLRVQPKTCIAAWTALDPSTPENGGLMICPGTHTMEVMCPEQADQNESFTTEYVEPPAGIKPVSATLNPGDTLFFNGSVVHGSTPNRSKTLWRRSFICHYAPASFQEISGAYFPLLNFNGDVVERNNATGGGPCGTEYWKKVQGTP